ncbi:MAG: ROK family transcriptional regulator [Rhizobiaceae bacterium]|nr:ROK family transcriptional regulator [Rhizobiaceae bacterium]
MKKKPETTTPVARQLSVQAVISAALEHGSITRTRLAEITGLSKQTMSEVVRDLVRDGWLREGGQETGSVGRRATIYEFQESACYVLGVDLGGLNVRAAVAALNGNVVAEDVEETDRRGGIYVIDQIAALVARMCARFGVAKRGVRMGVIAVSGVHQQSTGAILAASNISGMAEIDFTGLLAERLGLPLFVENAVDMATRGERWRGGAQNVDNFVFFGHGAGIGMGAVIDGKLLKGRRGAIGEIAFLPIGANAFDSRNFGVGPLEAEVGAAAMARKFEGYGGPAGATARDIFDALEQGREAAEIVVDETARLVALAVASVAAILDPELVIMGGQIGVHPAMIERVTRFLQRCSPIPVRIEAASLGPRAQLIGALGAGIELAYSQLFGMSALTARSAP